MKHPDLSIAEPRRTGPAGLEDLNARAACLINPESEIANDFLNHFNEILLLIENLPMLLPEMVDELLHWQPTTYIGYFQKSSLPGGAAALRRYEELSAEARTYFNELVADLNVRAVDIVAQISEHRQPDGSIDPNAVADFCVAASAAFRRELDLLALFVNCGYAPAAEALRRHAGAAAVSQ